jgi:hypothetical protein
MALRQLTTEVRNRLQLTIEVPSAVNCQRKNEKKKKTSALKCRRTHHTQEQQEAMLRLTTRTATNASA